MNDEYDLETVANVRLLWPTFSIEQRSMWVVRLVHLFDNDFEKTVLALSEPYGD
jgi:hypothetical protein